MWVEQLSNGKFKFIERYTDTYTGKSKKCSITLEKNTAQAKKQASALLQEKISKIISSNDKVAKMTLYELYIEWLNRYELTVKQRTVISTKKNMKKVFNYISKDTLIDKADKQLFIKFFDEIYTFDTLTIGYATQIKNVLRSIFNYAIEREYLTKNPVETIKLKRKKEQDEINKKKLDNKYLEKFEIDIIIEYLNKSNLTKLHAKIIGFLWLTGLRFGELQALQWKDFDGRSIDINGTLGFYNNKTNTYDKISPKTISSNRVVDLPEHAIEILNEKKAINEKLYKKTGENDFIFLSSRGVPLSVSAFNRKLKDVEKNCGLNKTLSSHIFRHSHVSLLAELNLPLKSIMERVGHSNANTTLQIYNHVTQKTRDEVLEALNNFK